MSIRKKGKGQGPYKQATKKKFPYHDLNAVVSFLTVLERHLEVTRANKAVTAPQSVDCCLKKWSIIKVCIRAKTAKLPPLLRMRSMSASDGWAELLFCLVLRARLETLTKVQFDCEPH